MQHRASRFLRWWWLVPVILVALIVAAVELMSWNFLKPVITERIQEATGRSVAIHGDVDITLSPSPQLSLHELEIDNPEWATSPYMLEAQRVSISVSVSDLFQGKVVMDDIEVAGSTLNLEQRAGAPANWAFGDEQANQQAQAEEESSSPLDIRNLLLSDSEVHYWAADADTPLDVAVSSLQMQVDDETWHTQATLTFQQRRFELEAQTDPINAFMDDTQAFGGELTLSSGESQLTSTFEVPQAPALDRLEANGELSLHNLADWSQWLKLPQVELDSLEIAARLERQGSEWRLHDIDTAIAQNRVTGELTMDTAGEAPSLDGQLHSSQLDVAALRAALPESEEEGLSVPVLPDLRGDVALSVDRLILEQAVLQNVQTQVQLAEHSVALEPLTFEIADGNVEAQASLTSSPKRVAAEAQISLQNLDMTELNSALPAGDTLDAELSLELQPLEQRSTFELDTLLAQLRIDNARLAYRNAEAGSDLEATLETTGEQEPPRLLLNVNGTFRDKPLDMQVRGAPLPSLVDLEDGSLQQDYPLKAEATSNGLFVQADTTLASILAPQTLEADVVLDADSSRALEAWLGPVLPPLPEFRLAGRLSRDHEQWNVTGLEGEIGSTNVSGNVEVFTTERPAVNVDLEAGRIDIAQLISATTQASDDEAQADEAQDDSLLAPLRSFDGQLELNANTLVLPNGLELNELALDAELEEGGLRAEPLQFRLGDGSLTASLALDVTQSPASGRLDIDLDDISLARLGDTFTPIEDRLGRVSGELHLEMSETLPSDGRDDLLLPFIGRLSFEPSELRFSDPQADTQLTLNLETQGAATGDQTFQLEGEGRYDGAPASLSLQGDSLLNARDPDRPYALDLEADIVDTQISLEGTLLRPLALEGLDLELALKGPNPQRLSRLLGFALPQLPPYSVSGDLDLEDQRWTFTDMQGEIGDSDLSGRLALDTGATPPHLSGDLRSEQLDIADLGFLAGATPEEIEADDRFVLPDTEIITEAWQGVSADISYRGGSVSAGNIPLSNVVLDFTLENGRGQFDPVGFGVGEGSVDLTLDLDAGTQPPSGTMQVEVQGVDLSDALRNWELADDSVGTIGGRGKLWVEGASVAELLASADGGVVLLMTGGRLEALLVEIAGLDAGQTFLSWVRGRDPIPIDCAYADLQARDGVTQLDTFVVDTADTTFTLGGQVNLNTERLDISIIVHPKDPSVFVGRSPLHLGGTFDNIEVSVHSEELIMRAGSSAALGALAGPLAALLPLVDVGAGADMEYCEGLISRSREAIDEGSIE
ncbi:AsmA family protein [Halomonas sp. ZH2S]|uniref:AsmA family protein n=1 Tax=Vreelandella zhuhanensis TaxID=2684210 RepID=A0A7X3KSH9_9GAMM|nr:AsmA family protein [Halomonas zhuhanensis]MWJ29007.1 AsmA family protein [Halomonas zhuhanensis]